MIARAFQRGVAHGVAEAARELAESQNTDTIVLSGGVFQNEMLLEDLKEDWEIPDCRCGPTRRFPRMMVESA